MRLTLPPSGVPVNPVPTHIRSAVMQSPTGPVVVVALGTPVGEFVVVLPPDDVVNLCDQLRETAREASTGLQVVRDSHPAGSLIGVGHGSTSTQGNGQIPDPGSAG